ncbi:MAG TPA: hypothetical protein VII35_10390 [Steroidobacteraceae bacterium]
MNLQNGLKLLLATAVAACCVLPANAQSTVAEFTLNVQSFDGGWKGNASAIGQPVTFDVAFDSSMLTGSMTGNWEILSAPITSAEVVGGIFGSGINLEPDGPGTGNITDKRNLKSGVEKLTADTSTHAPSSGFTGDVYGFTLVSNGTITDVDLIRDVYSHGRLDRDDSGAVDLSNAVGQVQAPEIDPSSAVSALTLLVGGLAVIRGRKLVKLQSA